METLTATKITFVDFASLDHYPETRLVRCAPDCVMSECSGAATHIVMLTNCRGAAPLCTSHLGRLARWQGDVDEFARDNGMIFADAREAIAGRA